MLEMVRRHVTLLYARAYKNLTFSPIPFTAYQDALNVLLQNGTVDCEGEVYQLQRDLQELDQKILTLSTSNTRSRYFWEGSLHTLF